MFFPTRLRTRNINPQRLAGRFRPRVEALEQRLLLATFNVTTTVDVLDPGDGALSLREAVLAANSSNGADRIVLPAGTYLLSLSGADEDVSRTGDLDLAGRLAVQGAGAGATIIDVAGLDRVFQILGGGDATLSGMTIQGGSGAGFGGGILNTGTLAIDNCIITDNSAGYGGGIDSAGARVTVTDSTFAHNIAFLGQGGAIRTGGWDDNPSILTVKHSIFSDNFAEQGGAIWSYGANHNATVSVADSAFTGNSAGFEGGAIYIWNSHSFKFQSLTVTIRTSSFTCNSAGVFGGAVCIFEGSATIDQSTFADNSTGRDGGAIYNQGGLTIRGSSLTHNSADDQGGAISNWGSLTVNTSTLSDNASNKGGGIFNEVIAVLTLNNCRLTGNSADLGGGICNLGTLSLRNSTLLGNYANLGADLSNFGWADLIDSVIGDMYP